MTAFLRLTLSFAFALLVSSSLAFAQATAPPSSGGTTGGGTASSGCTYTYENPRGGNYSTGHADEGEVVKGHLNNWICHNGHLIKQN